jgi:hypothetical protein
MLDLEKIKGKISALLAKTVDNGATKAEMNSALEKANQLMLDFFITENDLKEKDKATINKCVSKKVEKVKSGFDLDLFLFDLHNLFDCKAFHNKYDITFFGYDTDVELCCYFYQMIAKTCLKEKERYTKSFEYMVLKKKVHGKTLSSSFITGFLLEVVLKLKKLYEERNSNIPQNYGLMLIEKTKNVQNQFDLLNLNLSNSARKKITIGELTAYNQGIQRGREFELIQGIEEDEEDKIETIFI